MAVIEQQFAQGLPAAIDAEKSLLGGILLENNLLFEAADCLSVQDFAIAQHQRIFSAMLELSEAGSAIDIVTLRNVLRARKEVEAVGGIAYIASLTENLPRRPSVADYVAVVAEKSLSRRMIAILSDGITRCADQSEDAEAISASVEDALMASRSEMRNAMSLEQQTADEWNAFESEMRSETKRFFSYGIPGLDMIVGGLAKGEMTVAGGAPGQGKTSLVMQLVKRHCPGGTGVLVISPEMTAGQILRRLWAEVAQVPFRFMRHPERLRQDQKEALKAAAMVVSEWPLYIDPAHHITAQQAAARAKLYKMRHGVEIIAIDYLQKLKFSTKPSERFIEVGDAAVTLSNLAKHEQLAVLVLSSITDKTGKGITGTPSLGDLRMSGDVQFEASTVLLISRPLDAHTSQVMADGDIIIAKGRSDGTGQVPVRFDTDYLTFHDRFITHEER